MLVKQLDLPAIQPFASAYIKESTQAMKHFHYSYKGDFKRRLADLDQRTFLRDELFSCIEKFMDGLPSSEQTKSSLTALKEDAVAVVGGQQAGLLTGPLYSIHKVISIIKLAEQQTDELGRKVIPIFWIAGEDHDFLEINHVYTESDGKLKKKGYPERVITKKMASDIQYDQAEMRHWIDEILTEFGETNHTAALREKLYQAAAENENITKMFAWLVMDLFKDSGLIVLDAADPDLRRLESAFFKQLIEQHEEINRAVLAQQEVLKNDGFKPMIELEHDAANLFIRVDEERQLLFYKGGAFYDKAGRAYSLSELMNEAEHHPENLSNNVVTRPLMQEWLIPTLAFIGGPGEIAYWAELKSGFEKAGFYMPPVVPRLTYSIVERNIEQDTKELDLSIDRVIAEGVQKERSAFWDQVKDQSLKSLIEETENQLKKQYRHIKELSDKYDPNFNQIVEKNLGFHLKQLSYLQMKSDDALKLKHDNILRKYDRVENALRPAGGPQERMWNIYYYLNRYGDTFIKDLLHAEVEFNHKHNIIHV
ncbi:bacillithiol biosynthesis cysteine-adding enzyme BshC [Jeotgalibacillus haloalkalitolerans]|uniref:Putative cysteine ligase BshC n=1 Tax=Jeotgalibacillus haloalkalitolerans TaxID=3104292 RepID=A0ABU5KJX7_9BACL|nr:bacillithiol biosynthesis cysteine-adding enzyme BshC [Jeotgalibacillus sp. HH7-29]MDZ5711560.1 bacillithiol biosynthesis cysteine-adding enzyme BshC [Jeotgalibacillus sp. HH7-29]